VKNRKITTMRQQKSNKMIYHSLH